MDQDWNWYVPLSQNICIVHLGPNFNVIPIVIWNQLDPDVVSQHPDSGTSRPPILSKRTSIITVIALKLLIVIHKCIDTHISREL